MTYEVIILGHLHMPLYFIGTFTEYSEKGRRPTEVTGSTIPITGDELVTK